jgi:crossover junction endodeoxyribonuclease RuvC
MVKTLLNLEEIPRPDDVADGLAAALCCLHSSRMEDRLDQLSGDSR